MLETVLSHLKTKKRTKHVSIVQRSSSVVNSFTTSVELIPAMAYKLKRDTIEVRFSCVCPVIDHEFRHNIVKVPVDARGDSRVDPQTTLTML